ncbi:hypothetical protein MSG28_013645 [Choristoneura fumiferana]|uniref:Uncharacterized protein n=1 Tax=Choristoneura fumiferana TaxID=7141 RepID=A0ACC0K961_CHOFU|nr:hypothetical protein MSG28_013645 [Choristoneura fumiferana]
MSKQSPPPMDFCDSMRVTIKDFPEPAKWCSFSRELQKVYLPKTSLPVPLVTIGLALSSVNVLALPYNEETQPALWAPCPIATTWPIAEQ